MLPFTTDPRFPDRRVLRSSGPRQTQELAAQLDDQGIPYEVQREGGWLNSLLGNMVRGRQQSENSPVSVNSSTQPLPMQGGQPAQGERSAPRSGGISSMSDDELYAAALSPWAPAEARPILMAEIERRTQAQDPMRQLALRQQQLQIAQMEAELAGGGAAAELPSDVQSLQWRAEQAGLTPGTPEYEDFIINGGGNPATFRALDLQAQAAGFQPGTPGYADFMATRGAGLQANASRTGALEADIALGGTAAETEAAGRARGQATVEAGVAAWDRASTLRSSLGTYDDAIAALEAGAEAGVVYNRLPRISLEGASLQNAMDRLGLDVIGATTFGALSEGELNLAMQTAVPRNLKEEDLRTWLTRRRAAIEESAAMLEDAAAFLTTPGNTIDQWIERNRGSQVEQAAPESRQSRAAPQGEQGASRPEGYPEDRWAVVPPASRAMAARIWNEMTPEDKREFLGE